MEGKPYSRNTVKANSFRARHIFFLVPFKESRFPLFVITIQAGKRSSRSITERSCATGIDFFHKAEASNFQRRPPVNQVGLNAPESFANSAWFNTILYFGKRGREKQPEMKPGDLQLKTTSRLKYFISSERATKNQSTFKCSRFYTFCVSPQADHPICSWFKRIYEGYE